MEFQPDFEADLLAVCWRDKRIFVDVRNYVDDSAFQFPELQWLWQLGCYSLDTTGELPSAGVVAQEGADKFSGPEFGQLIEVHRDIANERVIESPKAILATSVKFSERARYKKAARQHERLVEAGKFDEARALMESMPWVIAKPRTERRIVLGYDDHDKLMDEARARRDNPNNFKLRTRIRGLDERMNGGPVIGDSTTIMGFTGRGKTTLALNFVDSFLLDDHGGVIILSEMRPDITTSKIYARRSRVGHNIIYEYGFTPEQEKLYLEYMEEYKAKLQRLLWVEQLGIGGMTRDAIRRTLDDAAEFLKTFSWVVLDTIDHMENMVHFGRDRVAARGDNANWFHDEMNERELAGFPTTQANREGADWTDIQNAAGTMELMRVSENVIALNDSTDENQTKPNPEDDVDAILAPRQRFGNITISLLKCRFGASGDVPVSTELGCSFIGDEVIDEQNGVADG